MSVLYLLIPDHGPDTKQLYIGWYPRYTPDDLLRKAEEAVGTMRLSEEERVYHLIARRPLPQFTSSTADRSELKFLRVNREGMNCLRMYLPYL